MNIEDVRSNSLKLNHGGTFPNNNDTLLPKQSSQSVKTQRKFFRRPSARSIRNFFAIKKYCQVPATLPKDGHPTPDDNDDEYEDEGMEGDGFRKDSKQQRRMMSSTSGISSSGIFSIDASSNSVNLASKMEPLSSLEQTIDDEDDTSSLVIRREDRHSLTTTLVSHADQSTCLPAKNNVKVVKKNRKTFLAKSYSDQNVSAIFKRKRSSKRRRHLQQIRQDQRCPEAFFVEKRVAKTGEKRYALVHRGDLCMSRISTAKGFFDLVKRVTSIRKWEAIHIDISETHVIMSKPSKTTGCKEYPLSDIDTVEIAYFDDEEDCDVEPSRRVPRDIRSSSLTGCVPCSNGYHLLKIVIGKEHFIFRFSNAQTRDRWFQSFCWFRAKARYTIQLRSWTSSEQAIRGIQCMIDFCVTRPLINEEIKTFPLNLIETLLQGDLAIISLINDKALLTAILPLLRSSRQPRPKISEFLGYYCRTYPKCDFVRTEMFQIAKVVLKMVDFRNRFSLRSFVQDLCMAIWDVGKGSDALKILFDEFHGKGPFCPHPVVLPNLIFLCQYSISQAYKGRSLCQSASNVKARRRKMSQSLKVTSTSNQEASSETTTTTQQLLKSNAAIQIDGQLQQVKCFTSILSFLVQHEDWRLSISQKLRSLPFSTKTIHDVNFLVAMAATLKRFGADKRCGVHRCLTADAESLPLARQSMDWIRLTNQIYQNLVDQGHCPDSHPITRRVRDLLFELLNSLLSCQRCSRQRRFVTLNLNLLETCATTIERFYDNGDYIAQSISSEGARSLSIEGSWQTGTDDLGIEDDFLTKRDLALTTSLNFVALHLEIDTFQSLSDRQRLTFLLLDCGGNQGAEIYRQLLARSASSRRRMRRLRGDLNSLKKSTPKDFPHRNSDSDSAILMINELEAFSDDGSEGSINEEGDDRDSSSSNDDNQDEEFLKGHDLCLSRNATDADLLNILQTGVCPPGSTLRSTASKRSKSSQKRPNNDKPKKVHLELITTLQCQFSQITSASVPAIIKRFPNLKGLNVWSTKFDDEGLNLVCEGLDHSLVSLNLCETKVTDAGLRRIVRLKKLKQVNLNSTKLSTFTHKMLLEDLHHLREIDVRYTDAWEPF